MILACAAHLESRGFGLGLLKSTFNAGNFIRRLFCSISSHFGAIHSWNACRNLKSLKNSLKPAILGVQGHSVSSMLTFLRSSTPLLVMISSMSVPICNHFYVRRAYSGKITLFKGGTFLSPPRSRGSPLRSGLKFCHEILETIGYHTV